MMRYGICSLAIVWAFAFSSATAFGQAAKGAGSPEEAVAMMAKTAKAGDLEGAMKLVVDGQSKTLTRWIKSCETLANSINGLVDSLDAAFGPDPASPMKKVKFNLKEEVARQFGSMTIDGEKKVVDADHATLNVKIINKLSDGRELASDQRIAARKDAGGWKLVFEELERFDFDASSAFMADLCKSIDHATKLVKSKSLKSRADVVKELEKDTQRTLPGNVPMPQFLMKQG